jgi:RimJ/RimL family protein N-acetyltransferase
MQPDTAFEPIVTERLTLRRSIPEDAGEIARYRSDPMVRRYQGWGQTDAATVRRQIEEMADRLPGEPSGWVQFTVVERDGGGLVGDVGLSPADREDGVILIGYTIDPASQGRGYATEAVRALIDYAFFTLGADLVRAYASAENIPSHRVVEKSGMKLMERFEGEDDGVKWSGVRYELRREDRPDR